MLLIAFDRLSQFLERPLWEIETLLQGLYRSWKTWKVMEFKHFIFQAWKVMKFNSRSLKVMAN